jgi:hypothetical protein
VSITRLRNELGVWRGVWQQLTTFLDRIDESAEMDVPQVQIISALLPVMGVIERARQRATGIGLAEALTCAPRGVGMPWRTGSVIAAVAERLPGVEDQELAAATLKTNGDGKLDADPPAELWGTMTMFRFRDEKHGEAQAVVPAYDFGPLSGELVELAGVVEAGHFPRSVREKAVKTGKDEQIKWTQLRQKRRDKLAQKPGEKPKSLSAQLDALHLASGYPALIQVGSGARSARDACNADREVLARAEPIVRGAGVADELVTALASARDALTEQGRAYQLAVDKLSAPQVYALSESVLTQVKQALARADRPAGQGIASALETLDRVCGGALDDAVEMRLQYPDGSLRTLRVMEWTLRLQWSFRERWFDNRRRLVLRALYDRALRVFCDSLNALREGRDTGAPLAGVKLARDAATQATTLSITPRQDLSRLAPGQLALVRGERPTLALLLDSELKPGGPGQPTEQILHIAPLHVSVATDRKLPGISGLVKQGTPIDGGRVALTDEELRAGASAAGEQADALPQEVVALGSRLALVLGRPGGLGRPASPPIPAPFPGISSFAVEEPVSVGATRLFLKSVPLPAQSGTSRPVMMARPGELLLIRGADADGHWWQAVIEVARVDLLTGAAARAQDELTGTPTPVCCEQEAPVAVITLRDMNLPHDLVRQVTVSRAFLGFGCASIGARDLLPENLDPETETVRVDDAGVSKVVRRDPELRAALRVLDGWLGAHT